MATLCLLPFYVELILHGLVVGAQHQEGFLVGVVCRLEVDVVVGFPLPWYCGFYSKFSRAIG
jgi:hypothetical protein